MIELSRRSFLKIAIATIATPVIARAAITNILLPGMERIDQVKPRDLAEDVRFANAFYTPAVTYDAAKACEDNVCRFLPHGTAYELRAVRLSAGQAYNRIGYGRNAYALMWVVAPAMQHNREWVEPYDLTEPERRNSEYIRLGRSHAGTGLTYRSPDTWFDEQVWGGTIRRADEPSLAPPYVPMTDAELDALTFGDDE